MSRAPETMLVALVALILVLAGFTTGVAVVLGQLPGFTTQNSCDRQVEAALDAALRR